MKNPIKPKQLPAWPRTLLTCLLLLLIFLTPWLVNGQCFPIYKPDTSAPKIRNVIFTTPISRNTTINGLAIGLQPVRWHGATILNINGLSISASPSDPIFALFVFLFAYYDNPKSSSYPRTDFDSRNLYPEADTLKSAFNGLVLGSVTPRVKSNGVNVSAIINLSHSMKGLSIAGLFNHHYSFKGVLIAGFRNKTTTGKGVQIGLLNRCQEGKVLQIGLLNKIGKRTIPFINFKF
ncbi:hypothetical protein A3860_00275 [Niastella vici]|uniref:Uncharacterized protein n=1 Tax=Niastella vici TaxID=1703345 RepID=A0A1V9G861_9BACT|nr:hypothetical protein [Niastella vici]OQP66841.1 hypothetical protein A3860_00275 [Niastella vici]